MVKISNAHPIKQNMNCPMHTNETKGMERDIAPQLHLSLKQYQRQTSHNTFQGQICLDQAPDQPKEDLRGEKLIPLSMTTGTARHGQQCIAYRRRANLLFLGFPRAEQSYFCKHLSPKNFIVRLIASWEHPSDLQHLQPDLLFIYDPTVAACERLRSSFSHIPLLAYSPREDMSHMIHLLDAGADDYITSSVGIEEVQARMRALLRSYHSPAFLSATAAPLLLQSQDRRIQLDLAEQCVYVQGKTYYLTTKESAILYELMMQSEKVISNVTLLQSVWGPAYYHEIDYLRVYISQLRTKIEETPSQPRYLVTVTRIGYVFNQSCTLFLRGQ